jgi:hypothetical protein
MIEFSAADVERALFAKELMVLKEGEMPLKRPSDLVSPPSTKKRRSQNAASRKEKLDSPGDEKRSGNKLKRDSLRKRQT